MTNDQRRIWGMHDWDNFKTFKERGEWVELLFMAAAASHGYHVLKPWGDSFEYDVGVESRAGMLRVQVKSSTARNGTGYLCQFRRNYEVKEPYSIEELDLFAMYVIPEKVWYLIPASVILAPPRKVAVTLCPVTARRKDRYRYERYREAWHLLSKTPRELSKHKRWEPNALAVKTLTEMIPVPLGTPDSSPPVHWRVGSQKRAPVPAARLNRPTEPKSFRLKRKGPPRKPALNAAAKPALSEVEGRRKNIAQGASPG